MSAIRSVTTSCFLLAVICLSFLATPANAGCCGKLFGRRAAANACGGAGYAAHYESYSACGQTAMACGQTYGYQQQAAPCAPCGMPAAQQSAPVVTPQLAPVSYQYSYYGTYVAHGPPRLFRNR